MKIVFKKLESVNLSTVFPVIKEEDYSLLSGMSLIIPDSEFKKIKANGSLTIGPFQISSELIEIKESENDLVKQNIISAIDEKNLYFDEVVDVLYSGVNLNKNVLLYGKGKC